MATPWGLKEKMGAGLPSTVSRTSYCTFCSLPLLPALVSHLIFNSKLYTLAKLGRPLKRGSASSTAITTKSQPIKFRPYFLLFLKKFPHAFVSILLKKKKQFIFYFFVDSFIQINNVSCSYTPPARTKSPQHIPSPSTSSFINPLPPVSATCWTAD